MKVGTNLVATKHLKTWDCFVILDKHGKPLNHTVAMNSPEEAWRFYFANRSGWQKMREYAQTCGHHCVSAVLRIME